MYFHGVRGPLGRSERSIFVKTSLKKRNTGTPWLPNAVMYDVKRESSLEKRLKEKIACIGL